MKRFWSDVQVLPDGGIALDGRPVRTPGRAPLVAPTATLAEAIADEWRAVGETIDPRAMPLTGLANAAIDRVAPDPAAFADQLAAYGESDLLCYRAESPEPLVARQAAAWDPPLRWAQARYDVHLLVASGVMHVARGQATIARLREATRAVDPWRLAGLSPLVTITGSLVLGLARLAGAMDSHAIWAAAQVDEDWQVEQWGDDPLARDSREARRREFDAADRFLAALER